MLFVSLKPDDCESNHYMPETVSIYIVATEENLLRSETIFIFIGATGDNEAVTNGQSS